MWVWWCCSWCVCCRWPQHKMLCCDQQQAHCTVHTNNDNTTTLHTDTDTQTLTRTERHAHNRRAPIRAMREMTQTVVVLSLPSFSLSPSDRVLHLLLSLRCHGRGEFVALLRPCTTTALRSTIHRQRNGHLSNDMKRPFSPPACRGAKP